MENTPTREQQYQIARAILDNAVEQYGKASVAYGLVSYPVTDTTAIFAHHQNIALMALNTAIDGLLVAERAREAF